VKYEKCVVYKIHEYLLNSGTYLEHILDDLKQ